MDLVSILVFLIVIGAALAILKLAPIDGVIKQIGYILIVVYALIWALQHLHLPL